MCHTITTRVVGGVRRLQVQLEGCTGLVYTLAASRAQESTILLCTCSFHGWRAQHGSAPLALAGKAGNNQRTSGCVICRAAARSRWHPSVLFRSCSTQWA
jgi:hypothetical protein